MMFEIKKLIEFAKKKAAEDQTLVIATIVRTIGSVYRQTGTQMVISQDLTYQGALSGGCVENEIIRQSNKTFATKTNVVFEYDGQYKLGCNGKIYILIEPLEHSTLENLSQLFEKHHSQRISLVLGIQKDTNLSQVSTYYTFGSERINISNLVEGFDYNETEELTIEPQDQLVIIGGEYDSLSLAHLAHSIGFHTTLIVKEAFDHPRPTSFLTTYSNPQELRSLVKFDHNTAVVVMSHSLSKDLNYLSELIKVELGYLGILGPKTRKETIISNLLELNEENFLRYSDRIEHIYGPVGLGIGATTPEEIGISILSEIISVFSSTKKEKLLVK